MAAGLLPLTLFRSTRLLVPELRVSRTIDLAHATGAERPNDLVSAAP
jgi:hypothetical protein